jgi:putative transcriptional regulator
MKKELFDELAASVREAGSIHRGEKQPSRKFEFTSDDVRSIRERLHKSQSEFARMIGVSVPTLQNWEQGRRQPQGPARALLVVVSREPHLVAKVLASPVALRAARASAKSNTTKVRAAKRAPSHSASARRGARVKHS